MFNLCAKLFGVVLNFIYGYVQNYGLAIIIFTVVLKICLLPMNIKQQKTMKKSAKLQEKVKEIQDKYAKDPTRMQQEMMDLYKRENMSPFSGCLTSIFQFIVILSMFYLVSRPLTYMLGFDETKINDYVTTIQESSENSNLRYREIAVIKYLAEKGEKTLNMDFFGLDLSQIPSENYNDWKVFILPTLYVVTSIASMKLTTMMTNQKKKEDKKKDIVTNLPEKVNDEMDQAEMMQQMSKNMTYMMPFMTVSIAIIAPLGLALYWFLSNLLSIIERLVLNKVLLSEEEE